MKRLLVVGSFSNQKHTADLLRLQTEFLSKTTEVPYDHAVWLGEGVDRKLFDNHIVIAQGGVRHAAVQQYLKANPYDYSLQINEDTFPCGVGWFATLCRLLNDYRSNHMISNGIAFLRHCETSGSLNYCLSRTNFLSLHPYFANILGHLFYTHGFDIEFQPKDLAHIFPNMDHDQECERLFQHLVVNPVGFVSKLMGDINAPSA
jgi:hypothetical protein